MVGALQGSNPTGNGQPIKPQTGTNDTVWISLLPLIIGDRSGVVAPQPQTVSPSDIKNAWQSQFSQPFDPELNESFILEMEADGNSTYGNYGFTFLETLSDTHSNFQGFSNAAGGFNTAPDGLGWVQIFTDLNNGDAPVDLNAKPAAGETLKFHYTIPTDPSGSVTSLANLRYSPTRDTTNKVPGFPNIEFSDGEKPAAGSHGRFYTIDYEGTAQNLRIGSTAGINFHDAESGTFQTGTMTAFHNVLSGPQFDSIREREGNPDQEQINAIDAALGADAANHKLQFTLNVASVTAEGLAELENLRFNTLEEVRTAVSNASTTSPTSIMTLLNQQDPILTDQTMADLQNLSAFEGLNSSTKMQKIRRLVDAFKKDPAYLLTVEAEGELTKPQTIEVSSQDATSTQATINEENGTIEFDTGVSSRSSTTEDAGSTVSTMEVPALTTAEIQAAKQVLFKRFEMNDPNGTTTFPVPLTAPAQETRTVGYQLDQDARQKLIDAGVFSDALSIQKSGTDPDYRDPEPDPNKGTKLVVKPEIIFLDPFGESDSALLKANNTELFDQLFDSPMVATDDVDMSNNSNTIVGYSNPGQWSTTNVGQHEAHAPTRYISGQLGGSSLFTTYFDTFGEGKITDTLPTRFSVDMAALGPGTSGAGIFQVNANASNRQELLGIYTNTVRADDDSRLEGFGTTASYLDDVMNDAVFASSTSEKLGWNLQDVTES